MGAWDSGSFDNDAAGDWADEFVKSNSLSAVDRILIEASNSDNATTASKALAACEVLARLLGHWGVRGAFSKKVDDWVEGNPQKPSAGRLELAREAIDRILNDDSELRQLWNDNAEWLAAVNDLRSRLRA